MSVLAAFSEAVLPTIFALLVAGVGCAVLAGALRSDRLHALTHRLMGGAFCLMAMAVAVGMGAELVDVLR